MFGLLLTLIAVCVFGIATLYITALIFVYPFMSKYRIISKKIRSDKEYFYIQTKTMSDHVFWPSYINITERCFDTIDEAEEAINRYKDTKDQKVVWRSRW